MTKPLTPAQRACLEAIAALIAERFGLPPTFREIGERLGGQSTKAVHAKLSILEREGCLTWERRKNRALTLTAAGWREAGYTPWRYGDPITPIPLLEFPGGTPEQWL